MKQNNLRNIDGEKIRWQYFTWPIIILVWCMLWVPYCMLIFPLAAGKYNLQKWLSDVLICLEICFAFSVPFILLSALNRRFFGRIICVLNNDGIHYKEGMIKWNDIEHIEYEIEFPGHMPKFQHLFSYAVIFAKNGQLRLSHAPLFLLSKIKKYSPDISTGLSKSSKWVLLFIILIFAVLPLIFLFA